MSDSDRDAAVAGSLLIGFLGLLSLFAGAWVVYGIGWALIVAGGVLTLEALIMGIGRRRDTLLFANTTNK